MRYGTLCTKQTGIRLNRDFFSLRDTVSEIQPKKVVLVKTKTKNDQNPKIGRWPKFPEIPTRLPTIELRFALRGIVSEIQAKRQTSGNGRTEKEGVTKKQDTSGDNYY